MREPINTYFQLGVIQWMIHPEPQYALVDSVRQLASDDFFDAIEIAPIADNEKRKTVRKMLESSHMTVCYGAHPRILSGLNPNAIDEQERIKAERALIEIVDEAHMMGAKGVCMLAGRFDEENREEAFAQLLKTTGNVCAHAAKYDMLIEMEVFDYDVDKCVLIGPAPLAARFAAEMRMKHSNFGLVVDLSHFPVTHENSDFVVRALRPYITHFHIGNAVMQQGCPAYGDKHPRFGFPNSVNDIPELVDFFRVLRREGFFKPEKPCIVSIEVKPTEGEDGNIVLANTKRVIRRAWAMLED